MPSAPIPEGSSHQRRCKEDPAISISKEKYQELRTSTEPMLPVPALATKWLTFTNCNSEGPHRKTLIIEVAGGEDILGYIAWNSHWRKYVFEPDAGTIYEEGCLRHIANVCLALTKVHKEK